MSKKLLIFPCNGNGLEALDCVGSDYECIGFIDDTPEKQGIHPVGLEVYSRQVLQKYPEAYLLAVPGSPSSYLKRKQYIEGLQMAKERFATVIHPRAVVSANASIGYNVLIMAGVVITSNASIGNHVCILPNSVIHHDSKIGSYTLLGSGVIVAGYTTIEENSYIGSGSRIINNITIGKNTLVGMGSTVLKDVLPDSKVAGTPARRI
jgi:sugar O-acyltransferase (sialic acid O-acetyltransferase NeuD family)